MRLPLTIRLAVAFALVGLLAVPGAVADTPPCAIGAPCAVEGGEYYLAFPPDWDGESALPAIVFFHGHRSSGARVVESGGLVAEFAGHGYLVIAPNGAERPRDGVRGWPARPDLAGARDDLGFLGAVIGDVAGRVPLRRERILVSGFSSGGSMAWMVACYDGSSYAGFAPVAGALRRPVPEDGCPGGPARMLHFHGFSDRTVPLEGRGIGDWHQGDVFESLALLRGANACRSNPDETEIGEAYRCRRWTGCGSGRDIELCLHNGGHGLPAGWAERAREWFEADSGGS